MVHYRLMKAGIYETTYGNACIFKPLLKTAWDIDLAEVIPLEFIDFTKRIRNIEITDRRK